MNLAFERKRKKVLEGIKFEACYEMIFANGSRHRLLFTHQSKEMAIDLFVIIIVAVVVVVVVVSSSQQQHNNGVKYCRSK